MDAASQPSPPPVPEPEAADARHEFLSRALADLAHGVRRDLGAHLALAAGPAEVVREEYERVFGAVPPTGADEPEDLGRLGEYRLLRELGRGGQAIVYLAEHAGLDRRVALKVLAPEAVRDPRLSLRLRREAQILAQLEHPAVCRLYELGEVGALRFLAMEHVDGGSLADAIAAARLGPSAEAAASLPPRARLLELFEVLASALDAAHRAGVLHRDVKPSNVLITPALEVKLVDFGLGLDTHSDDPRLTRSDAWIGTPAFTAPEVLREGPRAFSPAADVYSLGATLHECLDHAPFARDVRRLAGMGRDRAEELARVRPRLSRSLRAVLATALASDPARRYQTAGALAQDLRNLRIGAPVSVRPAGLARRALGWAGRHRELSALALLLFACAALLAALSLRSAAIARVELEARGRELDHYRAEELTREADARAFPALPAAVPAMERWLGEVRSLGARLPGYREALAAEQGSPLAGAPEDGADDGRARLEALVTALEELDARAARIAARRDAASTLRQRSIEQHAAAGERAADGCAQSPYRPGLRLAPQLGLVPLGRDPLSGLQEFAHLASGTVPARDPATGRLEPGEDSALVLVLVPGGEALVGAPTETGATGTRPTGHEKPVHAVALEPYFIGKHELTQGQWLRLAGANPSRWRPGSDAHAPVDLRHPVENVSWRMASEVLALHGLVLPTEAQWEHAARAGTRTPWWCGSERDSLRGAANLADRSTARAGLDWPAARDWPELDDGYVEHAPVGSFAPNSFGLFDVHGNVWELCRDRWGTYDLPVAAGDGERLAPEDEPSRIYRGGGYAEGAWSARSSARQHIDPDNRFFSLGLRPARPLDPP